MAEGKTSPLKGKTREEITAEKECRENRISRMKRRLASSEEAAMKGLMRLWEEQTPEEKKAGHDIGVRDGKGFTPYDFEYLTKLARRLEAQKPLSALQKQELTGLLPKYAKQLLKLTDGDRQAEAERNVESAVEDYQEALRNMPERRAQ